MDRMYRTLAAAAVLLTAGNPLRIAPAAAWAPDGTGGVDAVSSAPVSRAGAAAAAPTERLGFLSYRVPRGWTESAPPGNGRAFMAPGGVGQAVIVLLAGQGVIGGDFKESFVASVRAVQKGRTQVRTSDLAETRSAEGYPALAQVVVSDDAAGKRQVSEYVAVNASGRLVVAALVTDSPEAAARYQPVLEQFLKDLDLGGAGRVSAAPSAEAVRQSGTARRRRPQYVAGRVCDARGRPLGAGSAPVEIRVFGVTYQGDRVEYKTSVDADGRYSLHVPNGLYRVTAEATLEQDGRKYKLSLDPADGVPPSSDLDSHDGIVQDYVLRLEGGAAVGSEVGHGCGLYVVDGAAFHSYFDALDRKYPPGTTVQVLFVPQGARIDGSAVKPFVRTCSLDGMKTGFGLSGIPLAEYVVAARLVTPDGRTQNLKVSQNGAAAARGDSVPLRFEPAGFGAGIGGAQIEYLYVWE